METVFRADERVNTLYQEEEITTVTQQLKKRWGLMCLPCVLLLALVVYAVCVRNEMLANIATIGLGAVLIAGYDLALKPLYCYRRHLRNVLHGRVREVELPFVALSEDVNIVDGVTCRALTCTDYDAKGRPYDRLFYLDALKALPDIQQGDMVRVVHHDLTISDIIPV